MKHQINRTMKLFYSVVAVALVASFSPLSFAEDDMMGQMPNQQKDSMQNNATDPSDSTDMDHDHGQMKKDHAQMKRDHKMMMKHDSCANKSSGCGKKKSQTKGKQNSSGSGSGMMDDDTMGSGNSGSMDHM